MHDAIMRSRQLSSNADYTARLASISRGTGLAPSNWLPPGIDVPIVELPSIRECTNARPLMENVQENNRPKTLTTVVAQKVGKCYRRVVALKAELYEHTNDGLAQHNRIEAWKRKYNALFYDGGEYLFQKKRN